VLLFIPHEILPSNPSQHFAKSAALARDDEDLGAVNRPHSYEPVASKNMPRFACAKRGI